MDQNVRIQKKINLFIEASKKHYISVRSCDPRLVKKADIKIEKAVSEIKKMGKEGRHALLELSGDKDEYVAYSAAIYSISYNAEKSLEALKRLSSSDHGIAGYQAQQVLLSWNKGGKPMKKTDPMQRQF